MACFTSCCSKKTDKQPTEKLTLGSKKVRLLTSAEPLSAMRLLDSLVQAAPIETLADSLVVDYLELKTNALIKLDMRDSAYSFMKRFQRQISPGRSNAVKIYSGIWLSQQLTNDGKYFLARKYLEETYTLFDKKTQSFEKANALNIDGSLLSSTGDYFAAQKKLLEAIKIFDSLGTTQALGPVYLNLAGNYQSLNDTKLSLLYYRKACSITIAYNDSLNYLFA